MINLFIGSFLCALLLFALSLIRDNTGIQMNSQEV